MLPITCIGHLINLNGNLKICTGVLPKIFYIFIEQKLIVKSACSLQYICHG